MINFIRFRFGIRRATSLLTPTTMSAAFLDIFAGDEKEHASNTKEYQSTLDLLSRKAESYGLPPKPEDLSEEQQDILIDLDV